MTGRKLALLALLLGLAALCFIVWRVGAGAVLAAMTRIGWGFLILLAFRGALVLLMGASWWVLGASRPDSRLWRFAWARLIRDSASECLPLSQIGGFVLGARALTITGVSGIFAGASTVVDVTLELVAQLFYLLCGLFLLWRLHPHFPLLRPLLFGLAALTAGAIGFLTLQARGTGLIERASARILRDWSGAKAGTRALLAELSAIHANHPAVLAGVLLHLVCWLANGAEAWLVLVLMGHEIPLVAALVIDSLLYGLRSFAFIVPNALGVQEAGYVLLGGLFGLAPQTCLALSLLRRARDLTLGLPALAGWQALEGRRAWRGINQFPTA
jgi:putative membrane protein